MTCMLTPCRTRLRSSFWGSSCASQAQSAHPQSRRCVRVNASLSGKGKRFPAELITVKKIMGEGSYGQVFEVLWPVGDTHGVSTDMF